MPPMNTPDVSMAAKEVGEEPVGDALTDREAANQARRVRVGCAPGDCSAAAHVGNPGVESTRSSERIVIASYPVRLRWRSGTCAPVRAAGRDPDTFPG